MLVSLNSCPGGIGLSVGTVSFYFCVGRTGSDGQSVPVMLPGEALSLIDWDLGLPCSSGLTGKASAVATDIGLATVLGLATSSLGFEEWAWELFNGFSMVAGAPWRMEAET